MPGMNSGNELQYDMNEWHNEYMMNNMVFIHWLEIIGWKPLAGNHSNASHWLKIIYFEPIRKFGGF